MFQNVSAQHAVQKKQLHLTLKNNSLVRSIIFNRFKYTKITSLCLIGLNKIKTFQRTITA